MKARIWLVLCLVIVLLGACTDPDFKRLNNEGQALLSRSDLLEEERYNLTKQLNELGLAYNNTNPDKMQQSLKKANVQVTITRIKERLAAKSSQPSMSTRRYVAAYLVKEERIPGVAEERMHFEPSYRIVEESALIRMEQRYNADPRRFRLNEGYTFRRAAGPFTTHQQIVEYVQSNGLKNVNW